MATTWKPIPSCTSYAFGSVFWWRIGVAAAPMSPLSVLMPPPTRMLTGTRLVVSKSVRDTGARGYKTSQCAPPVMLQPSAHVVIISAVPSGQLTSVEPLHDDEPAVQTIG